MAAAALANMAWDDDTAAIIMGMGAIDALVDLERSGSALVKEMVAWALGNLACSSPDVRLALAGAGAIPPLIELLRSGTYGARARAGRALAVLTSHMADEKGVLAGARRPRRARRGVGACARGMGASVGPYEEACGRRRSWRATFGGLARSLLASDHNPRRLQDLGQLAGREARLGLGGGARPEPRREVAVPAPRGEARAWARAQPARVGLEGAERERREPRGGRAAAEAVSGVAARPRVRVAPERGEAAADARASPWGAAAAAAAAAALATAAPSAWSGPFGRRGRPRRAAGTTEASASQARKLRARRAP
ncbi:hypothetical protein JL722_4079 [Aureococcus anophagefferens]|nr:hypothetical protein JL722_4079 [Aureococcus anophagefferens]